MTVPAGFMAGLKRLGLKRQDVFQTTTPDFSKVNWTEIFQKKEEQPHGKDEKTAEI